MQIRDQHVLITGGSSGIGLAIARQALAAGARVSLIARDAAKLEQARAELLRSGIGNASLLVASADVANESELVAAIRQAESQYGPVNVLVTSAGIARPGYFQELTTPDFERAMAVNYFGSVYAVRAVLPAMRAQRRGAVVLISSGAGLFGFFGYTAYAPTKFAVRGFAEALQAELHDTGVHVTIVYPPDTATPQLDEENRTKPIETKAITAGGGVLTAEAVARATLNGVASGKFSVTPGWAITALAWFHSVLAPVLRWHFAGVARRARGR